MNGGYGKGHPALTEQDIDDAANAYLGGATLRDLASRHGVSAPAIQYRLRQRGITEATRAEEIRIWADRNGHPFAIRGPVLRAYREAVA